MKYFFDAQRVTADLVKWVREWFNDNGKECKAVLGISGGKDSTVAAAVCVAALGKDRVVGVMMPNGIQHDIDDSRRICAILGIKNYEINIASAHDGLISELKEKGVALSSQTLINLAPRLRMSTVYAVSQSENGRVVNTCNLSEDWVGYSTRYGDSVGDFSPLSHLTVQEVKAIGRELGVPDDLLEKTPSDGLVGKTDEENLGFSYAELDHYIRCGEIKNMAHKEIIDNRHRQNLFKLQLMPSFDPQLTIVCTEPT